MQTLRIFSRVLSVAWSARRVRSARGVVALIATLALTGVAVGLGLSIFRPFEDDSGDIQSAPSNVMISTSGGSIVPVSAPLDDTNKFFDPGFGTNGQACVTCHQPNLGFTINVRSIQSAFNATGLTDPLFRLNDTANDPNGSESADNFSLFMDTGVVRIGKTFAASSDFTVAPQDTAKFGPLPLSMDPHHPGPTTLSLLPPPLLNTNVHLDSSVLCDGRASIRNMRAQVIGAAKTLLLPPTPGNDDADHVVAFMLCVYTDHR